MENTYIKAKNIVNKLVEEFQNIYFESIESIYVCGSFCRGDWLNCSSDLDINLIYSKNNFEQKEKETRIFYNIVEKVKSSNEIASHCPGGIDYGFSEYEYIPKTKEEASKPTPYPYFSVTMFDLKKYSKTMYGTNICELLPETPNAKMVSKEWVKLLIDKTKNFEKGNIKIAFNVYKIIVGLQIFFGEITVNKYDILKLYQENVPDFEMKWFGEMIIRNYVGSIYPEKPQTIFEYNNYIKFMENVNRII